MTTTLKRWLTKIKGQAKVFLLKYIGKSCLHLLFSTCRVEIQGLDAFFAAVKERSCVIMLWHNRLALIPCILSHYTPQLSYAALVSKSRDGQLLAAIIESYKQGHTILVGHQARYQALREVVEHIHARQHLVILTPDGPRGPAYEMKPGIVLAALETKAQVIALNWEAKKTWQLSTWDKLRFPKPFTTITVTLTILPALDPTFTVANLEEAKDILKASLPSNSF